MRFLLTLSLLLAFVSLAQAHTFLDYAEPKVGSTVQTSLTEVKIWFTRSLNKNGCTIAVYNAKGDEVDKKDSKIAPENAWLMSVSVPPLSPGTYKVVWNAYCRDSHHTTGSFTFQITDPARER